MLSPLCFCAAALFATLVSAADSELLRAAAEIQAAIPGAKLTKAPALAATGGRATCLVGTAANWKWPQRDKSHLVGDPTDHFAEWTRSVNWRGRVLVTQFDHAGQAALFVDVTIGKLPNKSQIGITADRRGSIVIWGDVNVVGR